MMSALSSSFGLLPRTNHTLRQFLRAKVALLYPLQIPDSLGVTGFAWGRRSQFEGLRERSFTKYGKHPLTRLRTVATTRCGPRLSLRRAKACRAPTTVYGRRRALWAGLAAGCGFAGGRVLVANLPAPPLARDLRGASIGTAGAGELPGAGTPLFLRPAAGTGGGGGRGSLIPANSRIRLMSSTWDLIFPSNCAAKI